jgi:predicted ATP-grasp superfamily ATP-dependent carboligase
MNLIDALNQSPYIFYFLVVDQFLDIDLPELKNFEKIYLSDYPSITVKNSGKLLSNPQVIDLILKKSQETNLTPAIISFKPSSKIDFLCQKYNWININNPGPLNRLLEDKIKFNQLCNENNIPTIPSTIDTFNQENFIKYQQVFNQKLVIQSHFGWAGNSTFSENNWDNLKDKIPLNSIVKFSPFLSGYSLLNNCCLISLGVIQSPPALQYTGLSPFTKNPFTTVGRQWPALASVEVTEKIRNLTQKFSDIIKNLNYRGFFGLDFLVHNDEIFLLECNPRLTASFAFYTEIELKQNLDPLFLFHLAEFINLDFQFDLESEQKRFYNHQIVGSEITAKNEDSQTIKKYHDFIIFTDQIDPIVIPQNIIDLIHETK